MATKTTETKADAKADTKDSSKKTAPKRKMLTAEERVAKLEQDLAAARAKAQGKDRKRYDEVTDKIRTLESKRTDINTQLEALAGERDAIVSRVPELVNEQQPSEA